MFKKIANRISFPHWAGEGTRWRRLSIYDKVLDGQFYDHLVHAFYDEKDGTGRTVPLDERRPSAQYRLPRYVARQFSNKLFSGRHIPTVRAPDKAVEKRVSDLLTGTHVWPVMWEAAYRGSVGSVAITFRAEGGKVGLKVWKAVWCSPVFDDFGELVVLRVHYTCTSAHLASVGLRVEDAGQDYWFIRDYTPLEEVTYRPVLVSDWNPAEGFREKGRQLAPAQTISHDLGFVPAVWVANAGGSCPPDGAALWEDAISNTVEIDYLLSQASRGARYNCAPQLVTKGVVLNMQEGAVERGPTTYLAFEAAHRTEDGATLGEGDAKLLEMSGAGSEAALKIVDALKKYALEQIGVVQKDPGEMPGPLSGRAMEYLDQDAHDTAMQWRQTYGEGGALPLISKIIRTLDPSVDVTKLWLQWPRLYQPTPGDLINIVNSLVQAVTPIAVAGAKAGEDGSVPTVAPLLDSETASAYLRANLDLGILDDTNAGSKPGPADDIPEPGEDPKDTPIGQVGLFWRIFPPVKVR